MLTSAQKRTFIERGYVSLPGVIDDVASGFEDFVGTCLSEVHGIRPEDRSTWDIPGPWVGLKKYKEEDVLKAIGTPRLCAAIDDLLGAENWKTPRNWGGFLITFPDTDPKSWHIPSDGWHVDAHFTYASDTPFSIRVFTFLSHVGRRGGGTLVVSGSHRLVADYVAHLSVTEREAKYAKLKERFNSSHPWLRGLTGGGEQDDNRVRSFMEEGTRIGDVDVRVEELHGEPGDVILMHPWVLHNRAPNSSDKPRFMLAKYIFSLLAGKDLPSPAEPAA